MAEPSPTLRIPAVSSPAWTLRMPSETWTQMAEHINRGDDEHGGALLCGTATRRDGHVLLAREFISAEDGVDYVPGTRGHRALTPAFLRRMTKRARTENCALLMIHGHGRGEVVDFSETDYISHERGYSALLDLAGGLPVGALVITDRAVAGDIWLPGGARAPLASAVVLGTNVTTMYPSGRPAWSGAIGDDRQARLFGVAGRNILARSRVAVVGAGGAGIIAVELLARLGVGEIVVIDPDRVAVHNLPRLLGARRSDARAWFTDPEHRWTPRRLRRWAERHATYKTALAARIARRANNAVRVEEHRVVVADANAARALTDCDWIVLAADTAIARLVVNTIVHQFLVPMVQVGVKVAIDDAGTIGIIHAVSRSVLPDAGCLDCQGLIDAVALATEALPQQLRDAADYGTGQPAPAVATLNVLAAGTAITSVMLSLTGLSQQTELMHQRFLPRQGRSTRIKPRRSDTCSVCSLAPHSARAQGDQLPMIGVKS